MPSLEKKRHMTVLFGVTASICVAIGASAFAEDATSHREQMPQHAGRRPPPEAFTACEGKSEGAECSVSFGNDTLQGVCVAPPDEQLFCMPNDMPPPPAGDRPDGPPPRRIIM